MVGAGRGGDASASDSEFAFPAELIDRPQVLIGITGLDTLNNAVHRTIWEALTNTRPQDNRPSPVEFKMFSPTHFPRPKLKRGQYEMHIPKGILKRNWMMKHLTIIPAVVVVFYDLDWDDPLWEERKLECTSRVQSIKLALEGRNTRVCVVLIQHKTPLLTGEDVLAAERASALFQAADLSNKSLFILPHMDNLYGYTARLEKAFFELAICYYQHEIKQIKLHREHLNKKTHQYLYVRHQFKMGFLSELKQELMLAHSCYSESYSQLLEVRVSDANEFEVKTVAGYIVYKVCRMLFLINRPKDAISQFKAHIEHYKQRSGPSQLLFQHHAWLTKQFRVFAELFDEMVEQGSPAVQTQHPGFYYQIAAKHAADRRNVALQLCSGADNYPEPDPLDGKEKLEFYGQRPWRPCKLSAEPLDPDKERQAIQALQYLEIHHVCHSEIIIDLLGFAVSQFKTYRSLRMRRHLVVQMAEEYFTSKDYGKAITLLKHMLWDYRAEKWGKILDSLLVTALKCAHLTASINEFVPLCFEAASRLPPPHSTRAIANVLKINKGEVPDADISLDPSEVARASDLWRKVIAQSAALDNGGAEVTVEVANLCAEIGCKVAILKAAFNSVTVHVMIKYGLKETMRFSKLTVCVNTGLDVTEYPLVSTVPGVEDERLALRPASIVEFTCNIAPHSLEVGKIVQISSVLLYLDKAESRGHSVVLKFTGQDAESMSIYSELMYFRPVPTDVGKYDCMNPLLSKQVERREAKLNVSVEHMAPALLLEWYPITVVLSFDEEPEVQINRPTLTIALENKADVEATTEFRDHDCSGILVLPASLPLPSTPTSKETIMKTFYVKSTSLGARRIDVKVNYAINTEICIKETNVTFDVVTPFTIAGQYLTLKFEELTQCVYTAEPFLFRADILSESPWPVTIHSTSLKLSDGVSVNGDYKCSLKGVRLSQGERGTCIACLNSSRPSPNMTSLLSLQITWSRFIETESEQSSGLEHWKWETIDWLGPMPEIKTIESMLSIELETPVGGRTLARVRTLLPVTYKITNTTTRLYTLQLNMDPSDAFMFSGNKQIVLQILPESTRRINYNLYPLICGLIKLPKLRLSSLVDCLPQTTLMQAVERSLPSSIYVLPQAKGMESVAITEELSNLIITQNAQPSV